MGQDIEFELDEETDTFHLILDGEDQGPVDTDSLRETAGNLHLHFRMFRDAPEVEMEEPPESTELSDEEVEQELEDLESELEQIEED